MSGANNFSPAPDIYTEEDLTAKTIAQIKALADELGYTISKTTKAGIIEEFLTQQAQNG